MSYWNLSLLCLLTGLPLAAIATTNQQTTKETVELDGVSVVASRHASPTPPPRSVDSLDADQLSIGQVTQVGEALTRLPNVSLDGSPRSTSKNIRIRGLSGDRILTLIDGMPQLYSKGHLGNNFTPAFLIKGVELERGPASTLWGSGALGGVVSMQTKDANDLLKPGEQAGVLLRSAYRSASEGREVGGAVYGHLSQRLDGLLYASGSWDNNIRLGNGEKLPYSAHDNGSLFAKLSFYPVNSQQWQVSHRSERITGEQPSDPASLIDTENPLLDRHIRRDSTRLSWRYLPQSHFWDLRSLLYHNQTRVNESAQTKFRHDKTRIDTTGLSLTNTSQIHGASLTQTLTYGMDGRIDQTEGRRNGATRPQFPDAKRWIAGLFLQDEISWNPKWRLRLGARYDYYKSRPDAKVAPEKKAHHESLQAGLYWQPLGWLGLYTSYAEAFRAPSLEELYATGTHFGANHFLPNPSLDPETAANKEVGMKAYWQNVLRADDKLDFSFAVFQNDVNNFIDTRVTVVTLPAPPWVGGTSQSQNVSEARLRGFESRLDYQTGPWKARLAYGQTRGRDRVTNTPLADITPDQWTLAFSYLELPWQGQITWRTRISEAQDHVPAGTAKTPGYTRFDVLTSWQPLEPLTLELAARNLSDKKYRPHNSAIYATGRNILASMNWTF